MHEELHTALDANGILSITMNRPDIHNAFDEHQVIRITQTLLDAGANSDVRVVILAGNGRSFSAGGDLNYMQRMGNNSHAENVDDAGRLATLMHTLYSLTKPTIARVHGAAFGGGVGLVSCCDFAIGTHLAKFSTSEVKLGLAPATIAPYIVASIGEKAARRIFMTGEVISSERAYQLGFLSHLVEEDALDLSIQELATSLVANPPEALGSAKLIASHVARREIDEELIRHTVQFVAGLRESHEGKEGLSAFLEKRPPAWARAQ